MVVVVVRVERGRPKSSAQKTVLLSSICTYSTIVRPLLFCLSPLASAKSQQELIKFCRGKKNHDFFLFHYSTQERFSLPPPPHSSPLTLLFLFLSLCVTPSQTFGLKVDVSLRKLYRFPEQSRWLVDTFCSSLPPHS